MTDANKKSNADAVLASEIAEELAARAGGNFIAQVVMKKLILSKLAIDIESGKLPVYAMGLAGMEEQKFPNSGLDFPVNDYRLKRATVELWHASKLAAQAPTAFVAAPKMRAQEVRIIELLKAQGHDPLFLPARKKEGPGVKAFIKVIALREPALFSDSSFNKAWDRLSGRKEIAVSK
jgi:hypothetical protein|tara:strand:- start:2798 stop:3331 length:534 start_codon:yes stop_codon:yes gene_type:complete